MLEVPEIWDNPQEELLTGSRGSPRERSLWWSTKLKAVGVLKNALTLDMKMQDLVSLARFRSVFGPAIPHYAPFRSFWMV